MSDSNVNQYLEAELAEHQRSFKIGVVAMVLVSILIVGYFQWLKGALTEMIAPQNIATLMVSEVKRNLPTARDALEQNLKKAAPEVITFIADSVMDEALPMVTSAARALFRDYSRELTNFGTLAAASVFEGIVKDHKVELAKAKDTAEPGFYTPDKIAAGLNGLLERELGNRMNDRPEESIGTKLDESLVALHNINRHLAELASKKKTSREEDLGRRLITTWWTFLNQSEPQGSVTDQLMDSTTTTPKTEGVDPSVPGDGTEDDKPPAPKAKKPEAKAPAAPAPAKTK